MNKVSKHINNSAQEGNLHWRFDVNTFRLLGRELITDRITAVFELVKNCYDANATEVTIEFIDVVNITKDSKIIISDNGTGMSFSDIKDKWMVVGTNSKRKSLYSAKPFNRKFVGEKGIGRFAVDKLGEKVVIRTKQKNETNWLNVKIDWEDYENQSTESQKSNQLTLFTAVDNKYFFEPGNPSESGTQLIISQVSEVWLDIHLDRLEKELSKLVSPFYPVIPPFDITIKSNDYIAFTKKEVKPEPIKYYSNFAEINFDKNSNIQESLVFNNEKGIIETAKKPIQSFGPVKMKIYYFNEWAKRRYNAAYKNDETRIDGVKIYRDGVIATPFAEFQDDPNKKRDILGIDKRRWSGSFDKIATKEIISVLDITKENNPKIIDATNRQDFIDNKEYRDLKDFILLQLAAFEALKDFERVEKKTIVEKKLVEAGNDIKDFEKELDKIEKSHNSNPEIKPIVATLREHIKKLNISVSKGIQEQKKYQKEVERKEKILLSVVSMQEFASLIAHAVRTSIAKVKHLGEFFKLNYPNPAFNNYYPIYATSIYDEMNNLVAVTDFMLSYASADSNYEEFDIKELIINLLQNTYERIFINENILLEIDIKDNFIIDTNKKTFQDIFQNLVSNSIKALRNEPNKKIKCSGFLNTDSYIIYFSDNGSGIDPDDKEWIFGLFNTRTAEQGGSGVGLYIVDTLVKALGGTIEVTDSEFKPNGATFKITIPFNKK